MKKILFFAPYYFPYTSGITTYPYHLFPKLTKDYAIRVLTFPHISNLEKEEKLDGYTILRMGYLFKITKGYISPQSFIYFYREALKADIIMLTIPNVEGIVLAVMAKLLKKPIVAVYHCEIFPHKGLFSKILSWIVKQCVEVQLSLSDKIVGYTQEYVETTGVSLRYPDKTDTVLPPIPVVPVSESKLKQLLRDKEKTIWVGYAGRVAREKGLIYLVEAIEKLRTDFPAIEVVFAGPYGADVAGETSYYEELIAKLESFGISYRFFGTLKGEDLGAFYKAIDVLVLPSTNSTEAFGMVQAEAMTVGTPVVTTDLPGVRVPVKLTNMGIIVKPGNVKQLVTALQLILNKRKLYSNQTLVHSAKKMFTIDSTVSFYKKLLKSL